MVSYVGTGTYGESNPCSITFEFVPDVVWEAKIPITRTSGFAHMLSSDLTEVYQKSHGFGSIQIGDLYGKKSSDGKTFYWYHNIAPDAQNNTSGYTYYYIGIKG